MIVIQPTYQYLIFGPEPLAQFTPLPLSQLVKLFAAIRRFAVGTKIEPLAYPLILGTASVQILPQNPTRLGIVFYNPGPNTVAICPATNNQGLPLAAVIGGAGSMTLTPNNVTLMPPVPWADATATNAWNAIASGAATPFTVWEF
jgi:hypothetical protein